VFPIPVLVLFGPTASGKTEILGRLAAGRGPWKGIEVVSADSMQVYRGMDIGTAKPTREEQQRIPHHLIDIRNPNEQFSVGDFVRLADECCAAIAGRHALPAVSGGTGFYLKNFILGLPEAPPSDHTIRAALKGELCSHGAAALMEELARVDPVSAGRIHLNDEYRLLRALEVFRLAGRPLSSYAQTGKADREGRYRFLIIGLEWERQELYRRIDQRCAAMFRAGLPEEVARLAALGYGPQDPGLKAIGYREFFVEEAPGLSRVVDDRAGVETLAARNSRRYAKRQVTFFASIPGVHWIKLPGSGEDPAERIRTMAEEFVHCE
jgi:tRNA dimethylallyltransferase